VKRLFYLINFEFRNIIGKLAILSGVMITAQIVFFFMVISKYNNKYLRFENILDKAGYPVTFYVFLGVLLLLSAFNLYQNYFGSKSIYTLMSLPSDRRHIFLSKYISSLIGALGLAAVQIIGIFITYGLYLVILFDAPTVHNGLFLAFIRSGFLRILLPFDLLSFMVSLVSLASLTALVFYGVICERTKSFVRGIVVPLILIRSFMLMFPMHQNQLPYTIRVLGVILISGLYMSYYTIKAIKASEIL
jgi:ABC-type transport system involved in multi-copper enzyme maturation permease subunit